MKAKNTGQSFVVCIKNRGFRASLELRKLYQRIPDHEAETRRLLRVIDESGEDYLFPEKYFMSIEVSEQVARALSASG